MSASTLAIPVVRVPEPIEYVDRTLATASWWDRYELIPGDYPVTYTTIDGRIVAADDRQAYYATARIDAYLVETYRENRVFTEVHGHQTSTREKATVYARLYTFNVKEGGVVLGLREGGAYFTDLQEDADEQ